MGLLVLLALALCLTPASGSAPTPQDPAPAAPPRVLLVVADDVGWNLLERAPTPNLDRLAAEGMTFTRFWATPKCGPTRIALLTGRFHFRAGGGSGEGARKHKNRSLGLDEPYLPRALGPDECAAFGKWHLSTEPSHPNACGFGHFAGSLGNLNAESYERWTRIVDGEPSLCETYATTQVTGDALASDAGFRYVSYHAAHTPFHDPPRALCPKTQLDGSEERQVEAMLEALDTELGRLLDANRDAYVFFMTDNGTTGLVGGSKGTLGDDGIQVPLIVRGPDVPPGTRCDALVNVVDLYATIAELRGATVPEEVVDSISFRDALRGGAGRRTWNYACLFFESDPDRRTEALRNETHKLLVKIDKLPPGWPEPAGARVLYRMPGEVAVPRAAWSDADRAAHDELEALRGSLRVGDDDE